jgi:triosephosphate isomerase
MALRKPLVIGNWKMNGSRSGTGRLLSAIRALVDPALCARVEVGVCPAYPYLGLSHDALSGSAIMLGAQDVASFDEGAYTGEVSAAMLADIGCQCVLVGHSERRTLLGESDAQVAVKAAKAVAAGLTVVICVGETLEERESGRMEQVLARQVEALRSLAGAGAGRVVLAYEPVWAIGTGLTATPEQAQSVHAFLRARLLATGFPDADNIRILYGGSVKPSNAASLFAMSDIDGGLIGGAALVAEDFVAICRAAAGEDA